MDRKIIKFLKKSRLRKMSNNWLTNAEKAVAGRLLKW